MKLKTLMVPILGLSIIGISLLKQNSTTHISSEQKIAEADKGIDHAFGKTRTFAASGQAPVEILDRKQKLPDEIPVEQIQTQPNAFDHLSNGQKLAFFIPQEQQDYIGTVEKYHTQFNGQVQVSTGSIDDGRRFSSFTVTKGPELTLVMVATGEKVYQIEINNKTGTGTVIDDQSLDYFRKHNDGRTPPPEGIS